MKKPLKIAGIVAAVLIALLLAVAVGVKVVISPEGVRKTVLPIVEKRLHRQIRVGNIKISLFSGIVLDDLAIMEKEGSQEFARFRQLKLRYKFWPLLSKRIVVTEVRLDAPQIRVIRLPDGTFNYSDITAKKKPATPEAKPEETGKINLLVSKVTLTGGTVIFEDRKAVQPFSYTAGVEFQSTDIALDKPIPFSAKADIPGATITAEGKVAEVTAKPTIDAVIGIKDVNLEKLSAGLPPALATKARAYAPAGAVTGRFNLAGPVSVPKGLLKEGKVRLDRVQMTVAGQRASLAGDIALKGDSASSGNLELVAGPNKAQITFSVSNLLSKPISISSTIKADRFDLDPFLKKGAKGAPAAAPTAAKPEPGPLSLPVRASGTAQLGQTSYKGLPITQLILKYRLTDNILVIEQLSGNVAGGSFSDTARLDLNRKGFEYSSRLKVQGVQADPVVTAFSPKAARTVSGTLSLNADVSGKGTQSDAIRKNVSGQGDFTISEGKLSGAGLVQGLAMFLNLEQLRVLQFNKFAGTFRIVKGKVVIDSAVSGKDLQIIPKGTAGLDKTLDLSLVTRLSPALTGKVTRGDIGRFMTDDKGWGMLPLKVTGTFSSPKFRIDTSKAGEQLKSKAKEKLQQTIQEKLLKKQEGEPQRPERDLLEKGLRGVFGK